MPTLLKIDASPRGDYSVSRNLTTIFTEEWTKNYSGTVVERDLFKTDLPFVDVPWMMGAYTPAEQHSPEIQKTIKISNDLVDELLAADHIVLGTPMYNFATPAITKAYIDHIVRVGRTFSTSYEGLAKGKKLTIIIASGGVYTPGAHMEAYNAESGYLKQIFGFIGITDVNIVLAGGSNALNTGEKTLPQVVEEHKAAVVEAAK
ncbi:FMN-dependent NADH-azoreductase [Granulicella sp. WH15]|uniref:FMN-dependent NADH-azoreductase n=1 Tax=Granulicella sp. WH15 TaxID=2602070 RepID=UPI001367246E|nr:NAD(P)H-dependent oxidoreductase [Granulicella sp. WH15]QHN05241.1 FMN-dependent NADH-azoreductase [Granulicella sp. WH15]